MNNVVVLGLLLCALFLVHGWYNKRKPAYDLVIARYNEDLQWLRRINLSRFSRLFIYNKGNKGFVVPSLINRGKCVVEVNHLPNVGRCDHTYMHHIIENYGNLGDTTIFLPGSCDMSYKWEKALRTIKKALSTGKTVLDSKEEKETDMYNFYLNDWKASNEKNSSLNPETELLKSPERPFGKWYEKNFGQFSVKEATYWGIFAVSKEDILKRPLKSYQNLIMYLDSHSNPEAGHYFERSWKAVFSHLMPSEK